MRRSAYPLLAAVSLLLALSPAVAATRPRYGGTLRVEVSASVTSLDPAQPSGNTSTQQELASLIFDRLVELDRNGVPRPELAASWVRDSDDRRWLFHLRPGVALHNGQPLRTHLVVMSLAASNPDLRVRLQGDDVVIESGSPMPNLLSQLACARNSIVVHTESGAVVGTGPFRVSTWEPGKRLVLAANEDYWGGRPHLDSIEIIMARPQRDQAMDLQLGRADVVEVAPEQVRRAIQEGQQVLVSSPSQLIALAFSDKPSVKEAGLREAISLAVDRVAIQNTLLQKQGEAAAGLLPQWLSGYSFLFPAGGGLERARQLRGNADPAPSLTLAYDWNDPLARAIAERVAVNARDIGVTIQAYGENLSARAPNADARLVRVPLSSPDPATALGVIAAAAGASAPVHGGTPEELYASERTLRADFRLVPVVYVPEAWALAPQVKNWVPLREGGWRLGDVWLQGAKP